MAISGDIFSCHSGGGATGTKGAEARDTSIHPVVHRTAPQQRIIQPKMSAALRLRNVERREEEKGKELVFLLQSNSAAVRDGLVSGVAHGLGV